jgi:hypothetical protein
MGLISWLTRKDRTAEKQRQHWRSLCESAIAAESDAGLDELRAMLGPFERDGGDIEIELEMLDALKHAVQTRRDLSAGGLPHVETQHRVIRSEPCHFTAPASLPTDPGQASGRVLFTPTRCYFVTSGKTTTQPWHLVQQIVRRDRDLFFARPDGGGGAHYRFNTYADAVIATLLATELKKRRRTGGT